MEAIRGKEIGMIFQNPLDSLNPVYTVGDQTAEAILLDKVSKEEAWNRVLKLDVYKRQIAAYVHDLFFLDDTQQLRLQFRRDIPNFI